jgi:hypothetical protein
MPSPLKAYALESGYRFRVQGLEFMDQHLRGGGGAGSEFRVQGSWISTYVRVGVQVQGLEFIDQFLRLGFVVTDLGPKL